MDRSERTIRRGEIYYADLNPVVGSEQGGIRPVLILQNEVGNWFSPTVIVAAMTARGGKAHLPTHVPVGTDSGLRRPSLVLAEQVRTIDKSRLQQRVGMLPPEKQEQVDRALRISFALSPQREEEPEWTQEESSITMGCSGFSKPWRATALPKRN